MRRRDFLRKGLALGATALLPEVGLTASNLLSAAPIVPVVEPLIPIWEAAVGGHWNIVKEWLRLDPSLVNITGEFMWGKKLTLLHLAANLWNSDVDVLKHLVTQGADVNAKSEDGDTPLHFAAEWNSVEIVKYLVSRGADTKEQSPN